MGKGSGMCESKTLAAQRHAPTPPSASQIEASMLSAEADGDATSAGAAHARSAIEAAEGLSDAERARLLAELDADSAGLAAALEAERRRQAAELARRLEDKKRVRLAAQLRIAEGRAAHDAKEAAARELAERAARHEAERAEAGARLDAEAAAELDSEAMRESAALDTTFEAEAGATRLLQVSVPVRGGSLGRGSSLQRMCLTTPPPLLSPPLSFAPQDAVLAASALAERTDASRRRTLAAAVDGSSSRRDSALAALRARHVAEWSSATADSPAARAEVAGTQAAEVDEAHARLAASDEADFAALADSTATLIQEVGRGRTPCNNSPLTLLLAPHLPHVLRPRVCRPPQSQQRCLRELHRLSQPRPRPPPRSTCAGSSHCARGVLRHANRL